MSPGVKAALQLMGHDFGAPRPPAAWPLTANQQARIESFMASNGLLRESGKE